LPGKNEMGTTVTTTVVAAATTDNHIPTEKFSCNAVQQRAPGLRQAKPSQALFTEKFLADHFIATHIGSCPKTVVV